MHLLAKTCALGPGTGRDQVHQRERNQRNAGHRDRRGDARPMRLALIAVLLLGVAGCGGNDAAAPRVPPPTTSDIGAWQFTARVDPPRTGSLTFSISRLREVRRRPKLIPRPF